MHTIKRRRLEFASNIKNINLVEKFIDEICDEYNISNTFFGNILISVTEAVKNAIFFGNLSDKNKKVSLSFVANPAYISFTVADEGKGIRFSDEDIRIIEEFNGQDRDNGLFLIQKLADIVKFYNNGSKIEMIFHISTINRKLAVDRMSEMKKYFSSKNSTQNCS